jgi:aspartate aminotransferase
MSFANRTHHLEPEGAYEVLARANQLEAAGKEIIHLEIGQPDYATFENELIETNFVASGAN